MKSFYLLTLAAAVALAACSNDDSTPDPNPSPADTGLVIEQTEYTLDALDNRSTTLTFSASADWTLTVTGEDADWLTVTPASGTAGSQTVELAARRNFSEAERIVRLEISCGKQPAPVTVTQHMTDITDFTDRFAPSFARGLQEMGHIYDAEKISRQDMEYLSNVIKLDNLSEYTEPLTSLQGIEYFESLTELYCLSNQLTSLDVSANTALTKLYCQNNQLTSLDVSGCTALTYLNCGSNQLTSLDVSANTALTTLWCYYNQLESLDVSANTALTELECDDNQLTSLDVSANTALTYLDCASNQLTTLDVSGCTALTQLWCFYNSLESLDVSGCTALTELSCSSNSLTSLDMSGCTALTAVVCYSNQLTSLDVSANTALTELYCENNPGDGESKFPVTAWFDDNSIPDALYVDQSSWSYGGKTITIEFQKAE